MKENRDRFAQLEKKFHANTLSRSEYDEYISLMDDESIDRMVDQLSKEDWSFSKGIVGLIQKEADRKKKRILFGKIAIAASLLLMVGMYVLWPSKISPPPLLAYSTHYGETRSFSLPDGSKVVLNANSKLTWDATWEVSGRRDVILEGEAFFDVVKRDDKMPFTVNTKQIKVNVLGTSFNVRSRSLETDVYLQSGKIDLAFNESKEKEISMVPGDFVNYDQTERLVSKTSVESIKKTASWVNGMLEFENKGLPDILNRFEELYGVHFSIENPELMDWRMDLSLPYSNWDLIKQALEISLLVTFEVQNDTIIVK